MVFCFSAAAAFTDQAFNNLVKLLNFTIGTTVVFVFGIATLLHPFILRTMKYAPRQRT